MSPQHYLKCTAKVKNPGPKTREIEGCLSCLSLSIPSITYEQARSNTSRRRTPSKKESCVQSNRFLNLVSNWNTRWEFENVASWVPWQLYGVLRNHRECIFLWSPGVSDNSFHQGAFTSLCSRTIGIFRCPSFNGSNVFTLTDKLFSLFRVIAQCF